LKLKEKQEKTISRDNESQLNFFFASKVLMLRFLLFSWKSRALIQPPCRHLLPRHLVGRQKNCRASTPRYWLMDRMEKLRDGLN